MSGFGDELSILCSRYLGTADAEVIGEMIERLLHSAALTIAVSANGDAKLMQETLTGAEGYLYTSAADQAKAGRFINSMRMNHLRSKPRP